MWQKKPHFKSSEVATTQFLERALAASEAAAWHLDARADAIAFSDIFFRWFAADVRSIQSITDFLVHLPATDQTIFLQTFARQSGDDDDALRSCEVTFLLNDTKVHLRFIGRFVCADVNAIEPSVDVCCEGVVVSDPAWFAMTNTECSHNLLNTLFSDSPIPSIMFDAQGVMLQANQSCEQLLELAPNELLAAAGHYNILRDKHLVELTDTMTAIQRVFTRKEILTLDLSYPLTHLLNHTAPEKKSIYLRATLLPVKNRYGELESVLVQLQDTSHEKKALQALLKKQRALQESESNYRAFIANSSEAIWCYDFTPPVSTALPGEEQIELMANSARLSQANKVLLSMLGAESLDEILGMGLHESGSSDYLFDLHFFVTNQYQMTDYDIIREDKKGNRHYFQISCVGIIENNCVSRVWGITKDVTVRKRYEHRLEHLSMHDALTGLPNRANIYQEIERFFERNDGQLSALLFIDLDRFKEINDTLGHQVGDRLLQLIGPRIASEMTETKGTIARMGGDEFAVFLPSIRHQQHAVVFAHRILDALRLEFNLEVFCAEISASIGIALAPTPASDVNTLMRFADVAMYHAKQQLSGIAVYRQEIDPHSPKRLAMMSELGRAIREDQLCLHFQPKVNLVTRTFYGFEALLRWNHPDMGFVPPYDFIPIAEMTSLIHPLTAWVLEKSVIQCCKWREQGLDLSMAVNLSARNLLDENMPKIVRTLLQKYNLPATALELEITESSIMSDPTRALRVLHQLHELGVRLSIDDFGTGYSSLAYLKKLPVQTLKIDLSFIRNMLNDRQDELIVESTIHLAHGLSLNVVAEGVENEALIERLTAMGCDDAQGYHIGKPMPIAQVTQWIDESVWAKGA